MPNHQKYRIHLMLFLLCFFIASLTFMPLVDFFDNQLDWDFTHSMFFLGILLGLVYNTLEFLVYLTTKIKNLSNSCNYALRILPSYFVLNGFIWYFYNFVNKILSESKEDASYFQAVILAFSTFFLLVKIGREIKAIHRQF